MYDDEQIINDETAQMLAKAYAGFMHNSTTPTHLTDGQARSIIEEMCDKCISSQKKAVLSSIYSLMSSFPKNEQCAISGYYDGMKKLYRFAGDKLCDSIKSNSDPALPLTLAVLLLLADK